MPGSPLVPTTFLQGDSGAWEPVAGGESGASVFHDRVGRRYAKIVPIGKEPELVAERDRLTWFHTTGIPSAPALDWRDTGAGACLVTGAAPGVPASELDAPALLRAWPSIADVARALHDLPASSCPFDRGLAWMMPLARAAVAEDRVVVGFLPESLQGTPPRQILDGIEDELTLRAGQERAERVVCHGDLCLPNILVDPVTDQVSAVLDLGRLGTADPYVDLSLLLATARSTWPDQATARRADSRFAASYGTELDPDRQDFYLRLDPLTW